jgi:DNA-3-methyladenine glycosylase II
MAKKKRAFEYEFPAAVGSLAATDPKLARFMELAGPCGLQLDDAESPFESLVEAIVYQQLHGKAAETIFNRVKAIFAPERFPSPRLLLEVPEELLRGAGLSRQKAAAVRDLAAKTLDGTVPDLRAIRRMSDDEIIERLTSVRGVGRWTVEMFLIFHLGRPDVLPIGDYGVLQGYALTHRKRKMPKPKELGAFGERWKPYRTVASWYLWRAVHLHRAKKAADNLTKGEAKKKKSVKTGKKKSRTK